MPIRIYAEDNLVLIDGFRFEGWLDHRKCPTCAERRVYYLAYDAFFCAACNEWLEIGCPDPACDVCACRPDRPLGP